MEKFEQLGSYVSGTGKTAVPFRPFLEKELIRKLEEKRVGRNFLLEDRSLINSSGASKKFRIENAAFYAITSFTEGSDLPALTSVGFTETEFIPTGFGGYEEISGQALKNADVPMMKEIIRRIANGMARLEDRRIWGAILNRTEVKGESIGTGDASTKTFSLAKSKILGGIEGGITGAPTGYMDVVGITDSNGTTDLGILGTNYFVDYADGKVYFAVAPPVATAISAYYAYTDRNIVDATTKGSISYNDLVSAQTALVGKYAELSDFVFQQTANADLLKDTAYREILKAGIETPKEGAVGNVLGGNVWVTQQLANKLAIALQKDGLGRYLMKEDVTTKIEDIAKRAGDKRVNAWINSIPCILNSDQVVVVLNGQIGATDA